MENISTSMQNTTTLSSTRSEEQDYFMDLAMSFFTYKIGKLGLLSKIYMAC